LVGLSVTVVNAAKMDELIELIAAWGESSARTISCTDRGEGTMLRGESGGPLNILP